LSFERLDLGFGGPQRIAIFLQAVSPAEDQFSLENVNLQSGKRYLQRGISDLKRTQPIQYVSQGPPVVPSAPGFHDLDFRLNFINADRIEDGPILLEKPFPISPGFYISDRQPDILTLDLSGQFQSCHLDIERKKPVVQFPHRNSEVSAPLQILNEDPLGERPVKGQDRQDG
jgi:hypothetical protein